NGDLRDIPVDLEVAPFEREVLDFLRTIPPGETITYGEIARRLGRPGASRAVGTACARNPAVIVIPCHRVVPKSGGLGNYSSEGGPETKRKLLEREGARIPDVSVAASEMENPRNPVKRVREPDEPHLARGHPFVDRIASREFSGNRHPLFPRELEGGVVKHVDVESAARVHDSERDPPTF